jgi:hypothetical protein
MESMSGIPANRRWFYLIWLWLGGAIIIAACGGGEATPRLGSEIILSGNAVLTCSQECQDRGQCGVVAGTETQFVLIGSPEQPTTRPRQFALPPGSTVTIISPPQSTTLVLTTDPNARETVNFYPITIPDRANAPGWVAGWCLAEITQ